MKAEFSTDYIHLCAIQYALGEYERGMIELEEFIETVMGEIA